MMTRFDPTIFDELRAYALRATVPMSREGAETPHAPASDLFARFVGAVGAIAGRLSKHGRADAGLLSERIAGSRDRMIDAVQL